MKFNIIPVFFNIGVDEQASEADRLGSNGPQEKNNSDNFRILVEFVRKFKQKNFFNHIRPMKTKDEAVVDDLMMILKSEIASKRSKNIESLNILSQICVALSGNIVHFFLVKLILSLFHPWPHYYQTIHQTEENIFLM